MADRRIKRITADLKLVERKTQTSALIKRVELDDADGSLDKWLVTVQPPPTSIYAAHEYVIRITFADFYPFEPPTIIFCSPILSPAVSGNGEICEALLRNTEWRPTTPIISVITRITTNIFVDYEKLDPINSEAADIFHNATAEDLRKQVEATRRG